MKHLLSFVTFTVIIVLSSCQKAMFLDEEETKDLPLQEVTFNLNGFHRQSVEQLAKIRTRASNVARRIDFVVFDSEDVIAFESHQSATDSDFGTIKAQLKPGSYSIVAVAHNGTAQASVASATKVTFAKDHITDTFAFGDTLTVSDNDRGHDITLNRCIACFRLQTTDGVPDTIKQMKFYFIKGSSILNPVTLQGTTSGKQTEIFAISNAETLHAGQWDIYTFPRKNDGTGTITVQVQALNAKGDAVVEKIFSDVEIERGFRTVYSGSFFGGKSVAQGGTFQVSIDSTEIADKPTITY